MTQDVPVSKNLENQSAIPSLWRDALLKIAEAFKEEDYLLSRGIEGVLPVSAEDAYRIANNIREYGAHLISLPDDTWETSACQWMGSYWDVLIDLYTAEEGVSDLALVVRVYEVGKSYSFKIRSVHVP